MTSNDSDPPVHPSSTVRVLVQFSLDSLEAEAQVISEYSDRSMDAQADLSLRWSDESL